MSVAAIDDKTMIPGGYVGGDVPTPYTEEELIKYFGSPVRPKHNDKSGGLCWACDKQITRLLGLNSRARGNLARALGWKPKYTMEDFLKSIKPEVEDLVKQQNLLK